MPVYTFICKRDHEEDHILKHTEVPKIMKCWCGEIARRLFKAPQVATFRPYVTKHFDGNPIEVRTAAQEDSLCKKHGVYRMLDSEKIDLAKSKRRREEIKKQALEQVPWEKAVAMAEADHGGQKLYTPDPPKRRKKNPETLTNPHPRGNDSVGNGRRRQPSRTSAATR